MLADGSPKIEYTGTNSFISPFEGKKNTQHQKICLHFPVFSVLD
jgi:hypothetical protein